MQLGVGQRWAFDGLNEDLTTGPGGSIGDDVRD
jgi:hypothetical protein